MKKRFKLLVHMMIALFILSGISAYSISSIPDTIFTKSNNIISNNLVKFQKAKAVEWEYNDRVKISKNSYNVKLLGVINAKNVNIKRVPHKELYLGGQPLGIKLKTEGALVVALSDVETSNGKKTSPAAECGLQIGDIIIKINDKKINDVGDISEIVNSQNKKQYTLVVERKSKIIKKHIKPVKSSTDGKYKIGMWVRDSTAGVGTLTFYDAESGKFGALGHPITDADTGEIMKIKTGELVPSNIISVKKGIKGSPGELRGIFVNERKKLGKINKNTICGIFGETEEELINPKFNKPYEIALRDEIKIGDAQILTTIKGNEPQLYNIRIEKLLEQDKPGPKSMVIKVTDAKLIESTGGIVQGMSGSPIVQNGKIVGAVTHVLVNKPDVGYGIYIEWMINDAEILNNN